MPYNRTTSHIGIALSSLAICISPVTAQKTDELSDTPGKIYTYKSSAGKERKMEINRIQNHRPQNRRRRRPRLFNNELWRTVTIIAADEFLVKHGLLSGKPTLSPSSSGETLTQAP